MDRSSKPWKYTVLVEAHDKLGHQGNTHTYCLIKIQYYWKGMNKDIWKYIANCTLCCREKAKIQNYPFQMMEIPDRPFDKIAIDLITECETSTSGNKHIVTIVDHLTGWPEAYSIPDKTANAIDSYLYKWIPTSTYVPMIHFIRQWNRIQKQSHGPSSATTWNWQNIFSTISSTE